MLYWQFCTQCACLAPRFSSYRHIIIVAIQRVLLRVNVVKLNILNWQLAPHRCSLDLMIKLTYCYTLLPSSHDSALLWCDDADEANVNDVRSCAESDEMEQRKRWHNFWRQFYYNELYMSNHSESIVCHFQRHVLQRDCHWTMLIRRVNILWFEYVVV